MVLLIVVALVVVLGGGGAAYLATISGGAYPKLMWACVLLPPDQAQVLVPHGLPQGDRPESGDQDSSCVWSNRLAVNAGLEQQSVQLTLRVSRYGRGLATSAEDKAREQVRFLTNGNSLGGAGRPIPGYGDEGYRRPKAFGGEFDAITFRDSNLIIEVAVEIDDQAAQAWTRTQRAAALTAQRLRALRG